MDKLFKVLLELRQDQVKSDWRDYAECLWMSCGGILIAFLIVGAIIYLGD